MVDVYHSLEVYQSLSLINNEIFLYLQTVWFILLNLKTPFIFFIYLFFLIFQRKIYNILCSCQHSAVLSLQIYIVYMGRKLDDPDSARLHHRAMLEEVVGRFKHMHSFLKNYNIKEKRIIIEEKCLILCLCLYLFQHFRTRICGIHLQEKFQWICGETNRRRSSKHCWYIL